MNVAVIGWGSLIWRPNTLRTTSRWRKDGPRLPIEFARRSTTGRSSGCLTLVIDSRFDGQQTYWAVSACETVDEVCENLRERERTRIGNIRVVSRGDSVDTGEAIAAGVVAWLENARVDAAVWTDLPSTLAGDRETVVAEAVSYLTGLDPRTAEYERAREYLVKAPPQIDTPVRRKMRAHGWMDEELPPDLFE